ncbi:MAG: ABC transporter substrate-binding protein [Chloroflexota bacterium]
MKSVRFLLPVLLLLTLISPGCSFRPEAPRPPLRIEWTYWPGDWILLVAKDQGIFEKHGVQVEPVRYEVFDDAIPDMAAEKIDGGFFVVGDLIPIYNNDNLHAIFITDISDGADQVVATSDIQTPADLRGKRIGMAFGTFGELFVLQMLQNYGIKPAEVKFVDINAEAVPDAIPTVIDAGHTWEPATSQAIEKGQHIIFTSAETPGLIPDLFVMRTSVLRERPDDVRAFLAAWLEAVEFTKAHPEEAIASIAKLSGMAPEEISFEGVRLYNLEDNLAAFAQNPGSDTTSIYYTTQLYVQSLVDSGILTTRPDINQMLDPSFLPQP